MKENEIWLEHEIGVKISNLGKIKRKIRTTHGHKSSSGYLRYKTTPSSGYKQVHRLVMEVFDPVGEIITMYMSDYPPVVDHLNGIKTDNRFVNLEWVTPRENSQRYRDNK